MKIYDNGDKCPCCGQTIQGMSAEALAIFSQLVHVAGMGEPDAPVLEIQDMDTGLLPPPDAGINPPIIQKPKF